MSIITLLFLTTCFIAAQSSCDMLCVCQTDVCTECYPNFIESVTFEAVSDSCSCPLGYYSEGNICQFCPLECSQCTDLNSCTVCQFGYKLTSGKCIHEKYIDEHTWISYQVCRDFRLEPDGKYTHYGFEITDQNQLESAEFITCTSLSYDSLYQTQEILKFSKNIPVTIQRTIKGLPYHQWVKISLNYLALDQWTGQTLTLKILNTEIFQQIKYDNSLRHQNICGGIQPDSLGRIILIINTMEEDLTLEIVLESSVAFGLKQVLYEVGTCPRSCLKCQGPNKCLQCQANYKLQNNQCTLCDQSIAYQTHYGCLQKCKQDYIFMENSLDRCVLCQLYIPHCKSCSSSIQCTVCQDHTFLYEGKCFQQCPLGSFENIKPDSLLVQSNTCGACPQNCSQCFSSTLCLTCKENFFNDQGNCVSECSTKVSDVYPNICQMLADQCTSGCKQCLNNVCVQCYAPLWLSSNQCITSCPVTTYPDQPSTKCLSCPLNCFTCLNNNICLTCKGGNILRNGQCIQYTDECSMGLYYEARIINGKCVQCPQGCSTCYRTLCLTCQDGFFLDNGKCLSECTDQKQVLNANAKKCSWKSPLCSIYDEIDFGFCKNCRDLDYQLFKREDGVCALSCPTGEVNSLSTNTCEGSCIANCDICEDDQKCLKCRLGFVLDENFVCVQNCLQGTISDSHQCISCPYNCQKCDISGKCYIWSSQPQIDCEIQLGAKCLKCFKQSENICVECGIDAFLENNVCKSDCSKGKFADSLSRQCRQCKPNCASCTDFQKCQQCNSGFFLHKGQCLRSCPMKYYNNIQYGKCDQCSTNCKTCYGPQEYQCLSCYLGFQLDHTECVFQCPIHRYADNQGHCDWCHQSCKYCFGPADFQCIQCQSDYFVYKGQCFNQCPAATFLFDHEISECRDCSWGCSVCTSSNSCSQCFGGFYLRDGACYSNCPYGTYYNTGSNSCDNCLVSHCSSCSYDSCSVCQADYYLYNNQCIQNCPPGTYTIDAYFYLACIQCPDQCLTCTSSYWCQTCSDGYTLTNGKCRNNNECSTNQYYNSISGSCEDCFSNCKLCSTGTSCIQCQDGYFYDGDINQCVIQCSTGTYSQDFIDHCMACPTFCESCNNYYQCNQCSNGYTLVDGKCHKDGTNPQTCDIQNCENCPDSVNCYQCSNTYYIQPDGSCDLTCPQNTFIYVDRCLPCSVQCIQCNYYGCKKCSQNFLLHSGICIDKCPEGFFQQNGQCVRCTMGCQICASSTQCSKCQIPYILVDKQCVTVCPTSMYYSIEAEECFNCGQYCQICQSPSKCNSCISGYLLDQKTGNCYQVCQEGNYHNLQNNQCQSCLFQCLTCSNINQCTSCREGFYLYDDQCIRLCPQGYFSEQDNNQCLECDQSCLTCFESSTSCQTCPQETYLFGKSCVNQCPGGTYSFESNRKCMPCLDYCITCTSSTQCNACHPLMFLHEGICIQKCPSGYYSQNGQCYQCVQPCLTCSGGSLYQCSTCKYGYYYYEGRCLEQCPSNYYQNIQINSCQQCSPNCLQCSQFNQCTECPGGSQPVEGQCVTEQPCNPSTQEFCQFCVSIDQCSKCFEGYYLLNGQCKLDCEQMKFQNQLTGYCENCDQFCVQCQSQDQCQTCVNDYYLYQGICYESCPQGTINSQTNNGICVIDFCLVRNPTTSQCIQCNLPYLLQQGFCRLQCSSGNYASQMQCLPCFDHCQQCLNAFSCQQCSDNYILHTGKCLDQCPSGSFLDITIGYCQECEQNCLLCVNYQQCTQCQTGYYLHQGKCVQTCPYLHYPQSANGKCEDCSNHCILCSSQNNCQQCSQLYALHNGMCVMNCPSGYYKDLLNFICIQCQNNCVSCNSDICYSCSGQYLLYNGQCYQQCPQGTYQSSEQCIECTETNCEQCSSAIQCTLCSENKFLFNGDCMDSCPDGYFSPVSNNVCEQCDPECENCQVISDKCTSCPSGYTLDVDYCRPTCLSSEYLNSQGECQLCPTRCKSCLNANQCLSCQDTYFLHEKRCVQNCPEGYYGENKQCFSCILKCEKCEKDGCNECEENYFLLEIDQQQHCVLVCPPGTYPNSETNSCQECGQSCLSCSDLQTCMECESDKFLSQQNQCVDTCPPGFFSNIDNNCIECSTNCKICHNITYCSQCQDTYNIFNGQCVQNCPSGTYKTSEMICQICNQQYCLQCTGELQGECTVCQGSYILDGICYLECPQGYYGLDSRCVEDSVPCSGIQFRDSCYQYCPHGFYQDKIENTCIECPENCNLCQNADSCESCIQGLVLHEGSCVNFCPQFHSKVDKICVQCLDQNCHECFLDPSYCEVCSTNYYLYMGQCVNICPSGTYSNQDQCGQCSHKCQTCQNIDSCKTCANPSLNPPQCSQTICSDSQYLDTDGNCKNCHNSCQTCFGPHFDDCETCPSDLILHQQQCRTSCPSYYYHNTINNQCQHCSDNCEQCISQQQCNKCIQNYILHEGICVSSCQNLNTQTSVYYLNVDKCQACSDNCIECNIQGCQTCSTGYYMNNDKECISDCPPGQYPSQDICINCPNNCLNCVSYDSCQQCASGFKLYNNYCEESCPLKTFEQENICIECSDIRCNICTAADICTQCAPPFLSINNQCSSCLQGYVYNALTQTCIRCSEQCLTCKNNYAYCTDCPTGFNLFQGDCVVQCPIGHYSNSGQCVICTQPNCAICDLQNCQKCSYGYFMNEDGQCNSECPQSTYQSLIDRSCINCQPNCLHCTFSGCQQCKQQYAMHQTECVLECPIGTFKLNKQCKPCQIGCRICTDSQSCQQCRSDYQLISGECQKIICPIQFLQLSDGSCINECQLSHVYNPQTKQCDSCPSLCETCSLDGNCQTCITDSFLYEQKCYEQCPSGTFNNTLNTCHSCSQYCVLCTSSSQCTQCGDNTYLHLGTCLENCLVGYYENGNICSQCPQNCLNCTSQGCNICANTYYLHNNECKDQCPEKTYTQGQQCFDCVQPCDECSSSSFCDSCIVGFSLTDKNQCVNDCGSGKYNSSTGICQNCGLNNCEECDANNCFQCADNYYLYSDSLNDQHCDQKCPTGLYENNAEKTCQICPQQCSECESQIQCITCKQQYQLYNSQCINQCPPQTYPENNICMNCSVNCKECMSVQECTICSQNYILYQNQNSEIVCLNQCPSKYFHNTTINMCDSCGQQCAKCLNQDICQQCTQLNYIVEGGICIPGECENCQKCVNKICQECLQGFYLYEGLCYEECPDPYYGDDSDKQCKICMDHCLQCSNDTYCDVCETDFTFSDEQCIDNAVLEYGDLANISGFTSNITEITSAIYISTSIGPVAFGQMSNTYFNIQICQFILFHSSAAGDNPEVDQFLDSLSSMSLSLSQNDEQQPLNTTARRRMLESVIEEPEAFLAVNALIFVLAGAFLAIYLFIYIFQKNIDSCCSTCPKLFFVINQICQFMKQRFKWIYFDFVMWLAYIPFLFFAMKQLSVFPFSNFIQGLSSILSIIIIATLPVYPGWITYLIYKNYNDLVKKDNRLVQMSLYPYVYKVKRPESVVPQNQPLRDYLTFQNIRLLVDPLKYLRKFIFVLVIVVSTQTPVVTLSILTGLNVLFIVYLIVYRPREMPYLVLDFIIEFLLLGFEIFMVVYVSTDGSKISAMSIVTHAVGFITANLSLILAIILNLIAYYKIFMCLRELYLHLKEKLQEKQKKDLQGSDQDGLTSNINDFQKDKQLNKDSRIINEGDTQYDPDQRNFKDGKSIFSQNIHDENSQNLLIDSNGMPILKDSSKLKNKQYKDKQLGNIPQRRNSDSITQYDIQDGNSDFFKKNKDIYMDEDGNIIKNGEMPQLNSDHRKHPRRNHKRNNSNLMDKDLGQYPANRDQRNDDQLTEQDPSIISSHQGSNLILDKDVFGKDNDYIRGSIGQQIPDLKQSKEKKVNKNNDRNMGDSSVSDDMLVSDGKIKDRENIHRRSKGGDTNIVTNGQQKIKDKDRHRRPNLNRIQSRNQEENDIQQADPFDRNLTKNKDKNKQELENGNMVQRNINKKGYESKKDGNLQQGNMFERNIKSNRNNKHTNDNEIDDGYMFDRKNTKTNKQQNVDNLQQGQFKDRNNINIIGSQKDVQNGKFKNRTINKNPNQMNNQTNNQLQDGQMIDRNNAKKNKSAQNQFDDFIDEANLQSRKSNKQNGVSALKNQNKDKNDGEIEDAQFRDRNIDKKANIQKNNDQTVPEGNLRERQPRSKQKVQKGQKLSQGNIKQAKMTEKIRNKNSLLDQFNQFEQQKMKQKEIQQANMKQRRVNKNSKNQQKQDEQIDEGVFFQRDHKKKKSHASKKQEEIKDIQGGVLKEREKKKYQRHQQDQINTHKLSEEQRKQSINSKNKKNFGQIDDIDDVFFSGNSQQLPTNQQRAKLSSQTDQFEEENVKRPNTNKSSPSKPGKGHLNINDNDSGLLQNDTYSKMVRANKEQLKKMSPQIASMMINQLPDDSEQQENYRRPQSKIQRPGSASSDNGSIASHRSRSKISKMKNKHGHMNLDQPSQFSADSDFSDRPSSKSKQHTRKVKRRKGENLNIRNDDNTEDIDEMKL